jgi:hypothetical protein
VDSVPRDDIQLKKNKCGCVMEIGLVGGEVSKPYLAAARPIFHVRLLLWDFKEI